LKTSSLKEQSSPQNSLNLFYTILTRTSCLLLITITPDTQEMYFPVLKQLRADRLICWDAASKQQLSGIQARAADVNVQADEQDE